MKRYLDTQEGDDEFLKQSIEEIKMLSGMTIEMFEDNPKLLLSPIFRKIILKQAKLVKKHIGFLSYQHIAIDNLGEPLKNQFEKLTTEE